MGKSAMPRKNSAKNDIVMTPPDLAESIVRYFAPKPKPGQHPSLSKTLSYCDPCYGQGSFFQAVARLNKAQEIKLFASGAYDLVPDGKIIQDSRDFYECHLAFDWIISNPPYSHLTDFLAHSFKRADNIVYLVQATAPFFTSRIRLTRQMGFGIKEMLLIDCPDEWKKAKLSFGTGLAAVHWQHGYDGGIKMTDVRKYVE